MNREAVLYERLPGGDVRCDVCAHRCHIAEGQRGLCQVRENRGGVLVSLAYGRVLACDVEPIEKKPLYHFHPGSTTLSIAAAGCNFRCRFCENWRIALLVREHVARPSLKAAALEREPISGGAALPWATCLLPSDHVLRAARVRSPSEIVAAAKAAGARSVTFTHTEPAVFVEYTLDTAHEAKEARLDNVLVTNGYLTDEALELCRPVVDAANVDLFSMDDATYRRILGARLRPILRTLERMRELGLWVEVTTLIIPGVNDDERELRDVASFVARVLGPDVPWHVARFFPAYRMALVCRTPLRRLRRAREIGFEAGLRNVYVGNVPGVGQCTRCHRCGVALLRRRGSTLLENRVSVDGRCPRCGTGVAGVGMANRPPAPRSSDPPPTVR